VTGSTGSTGTNGAVGEHPLDDLAAYALDALDTAERRTVDDHLVSCVPCRDELAGHQEALASLTATADEAPPAAVWHRVAAAIGAPALPGLPAQPDRSDRPQPEPVASSRLVDVSDPAAVTLPALRETASARPRPRPSRLRWLAVAAACLVLGGVAGYALGSSGDDADIDTLAQRASDEPGGVLATLDDTSGRPVARVVTDQDGAYMVLEGLQDLPSGRAYQLWSLTGAEPVSLGMLGRDGTNTVAFRLPPTITDLAISVEPTSGEVAPSGDFQASGSISADAVAS
jgi:anti-sigma-K factor RskA